MACRAAEEKLLPKAARQNSLFITAVMSGVMLLGPGWKLRCLCVIYKLHM